MGQVSRNDHEAHMRDEAIIRRGLTQFVAVGQALMRIRERGSYRENYSTFDQYLHERWNLSESHGYALMAGAEVVATLAETSAMAEEIPAPANERQARELARLRKDPEAMREAWADAVEHTHGDGQPTAREVREAVSKRLSPEPRRRVVPPKPDVEADRVRQHGERVALLLAMAKTLEREVMTTNLVDIALAEDRRLWCEQMADTIERLRPQYDRLRRT